MKKMKFSLIDAVIFIIMPISLALVSSMLNNRGKTLVETGEYSKLDAVLFNISVMNVIHLVFMVLLLTYVLFIRNKK
jgi:hypothetical protein